MKRVLVANCGEIAVRVVRGCLDEGLASVAVVTEVDRGSLASRMADRTVEIGASYLNVGAIVGAAIASGCDAIHPGYGFLSERPELAEACEANGIRRGGNKVAAREIARAEGIPVGEGSDEATVEAAERIGFPILLKAAAGGGGRGMVRVHRTEDLRSSFERASREAEAAFGDGSLYVERYVANARHVEVQILADGQGGVIHLGERDCSCQRRDQKLVEEAPSASLPASLRERLWDSAVALAQALDYRSAGTVEFLVDSDREDFFFLEVNTRVQVEHPVTEMVTGVDIVREQLRIVAGAPLSLTQDDVRLDGHAIECRINAESDAFEPSPGLIERWTPPAGAGIRVDSHCHDGYTVGAFYDSVVANLICHGSDRAEAIALMRRALERFKVEGIDTTVGIQHALISHGDFRADRVNTRWVEEHFLPAWTAQH